MTTPIERLRSIGWGGELLDALELDSEVSTDIRVRVAALKHSYPSPQKLHALIDSRPVVLPIEIAEAFGAAGQLFVDLARRACGCAQTRRQLMYVQRHFPAQDELNYCTDPLPSWSISDWIEPDRNEGECRQHGAVWNSGSPNSADPRSQPGNAPSKRSFVNAN